jgi:predicted HD phosphohydrolase
MPTLRTVDDLLALLAESERFDDGEVVDLLAHALQCGARLAEAAPGDVELQVAGLVHDVGHVLVPGSPNAHAGVAARAVRPLLGDRVAWLVANHVLAKRYLVAADPAYREQLSPASVASLAAQGDALDQAAMARLDAAPDRDAALALRRADDEAKVPGAVVPGLDDWRPSLLLVTADRNSSGRA